MKTILQLEKLFDDASQAVARATSEETRNRATKDLKRVALQLATAKARIEMRAEEEEEEEEKSEEDSADDEEEEEKASSKKADDEPKKPLMKKSVKAEKADDEGDDADSDDGDSGDAEEEEEEKYEEGEEEEEKADDEDDDSASSDSDDSDADSDMGEEEEEKAMLSAKSGLYTPKSLYQLAKRITGKNGVSQVFGALDALGLQKGVNEKLNARIKKLEAGNRAEKVNAMLVQARREGKINKAAMSSLREQGMRDPKWLKGHLDVLPARVRTLEEGVAEGKSYAGNAKDETSTKKGQELIESQGLNDEQKRMLTAMSAGTGQDLDDFVESMNKTRQRLRVVGGKGK